MPLPTWTYSQLLDDAWDAKVCVLQLCIWQPLNLAKLTFFYIGDFFKFDGEWPAVLHVSIRLYNLSGGLVQITKLKLYIAGA